MEEVKGIVKNAIEKGWPPQEIEKSLVNAGYSQEEIRIALSGKAPSINSPSPAVQNPQSLSNYQIKEASKKQAHKGLIIALVVLLLVVIGAAAAFLLLK